MSETPRTDEVNKYLRIREEYAKTDNEIWVNHARTLERELNASNAKIERLTAKVAQLYEGAEEQKHRINQLEEENDAMRADLLLWNEKEVKL